MRTVPTLRPGLLLDRDGVIVEDVGYLSCREGVRILEGVPVTIARFNAMGVPVVVVSNQSGVARGLFSEEAVTAVNQRIAELLAASGARIDRFYFCPDHPVLGLERYRNDSDRRKPGPGMLHEAANDLGLDLRRSVVVGDKLSDIQAGLAVEATTILVRTGYGTRTEATCDAIWDFAFEDLRAAEDCIALLIETALRDQL